MDIKSQSIAKQDGNFYSENEDAVFVSDDKKRFALSDGAGGTGVEAHRWSQYLLEKLPETPIKSFTELSAWQDSIWQSYFDTIQTDLENNAPHALDKFFTEGSSATLISVWLEVKEKTKKAHIVSYGDSVICLFRAKAKEIKTNIQDLSVFLESPFLLNSNELPTEHGIYETWDIKKGDVLLIASDTIGQFILSSYYILQEPEKHQKVFDVIKNSPVRFADIFQKLEDYYRLKSEENWQTVFSMIYESLISEMAFKTYTEALKGFGVMGLDDYSVAFVKF
jgi:hypothetical protein